jgi:hypothetical protein
MDPFKNLYVYLKHKINSLRFTVICFVMMNFINQQHMRISLQVNNNNNKKKNTPPTTKLHKFLLLFVNCNEKMHFIAYIRALYSH